MVLRILTSLFLSVFPPLCLSLLDIGLVDDILQKEGGHYRRKVYEAVTNTDCQDSG